MAFLIITRHALVNGRQQHYERKKNEPTGRKKKKKTERQFNEMIAAQDTDAKLVDR